MTGFDTNILIYSCDHADTRRQQRAFDLLAHARDGVLLLAGCGGVHRGITKVGAEGIHSFPCLGTITRIYGRVSVDYAFAEGLGVRTSAPI